jgi:hypothetical protein
MNERMNAKEKLHYGEIRSDYVNDNGIVYIDAWETDDDSEFGVARDDAEVKEAIREIQRNT